MSSAAAPASVTQRTARELAQRYIANPKSLPPTLAHTVLQVAAANGDSALYDASYQRRFRGRGQ